MFRLTLTLMILITAPLALAVPGWAESASFNLTVVIPASVQMNTAAVAQDAAYEANRQAASAENSTRTILEQQMVRDQRTVTVRSIVVL